MYKGSIAYYASGNPIKPKVLTAVSLTLIVMKKNIKIIKIRLFIYFTDAFSSLSILQRALIIFYEI